MQCRARGIESSPGCNTFTEKLVEDVQRQSTEGRGYKHIYENTRMTPSLMPCRSSERGKDVKNARKRRTRGDAKLAQGFVRVTRSCRRRFGVLHQDARWK